MYFYRRNLIVHTEGIINDIYRAKTQYKGKDHILSTDSTYLNRGVELFDFYAKIIKQFFIRKFSQKGNNYS